MQMRAMRLVFRVIRTNSIGTGCRQNVTGRVISSEGKRVWSDSRPAVLRASLGTYVTGNTLSFPQPHWGRESQGSIYQSVAVR